MSMQNLLLTDLFRKLCAYSVYNSNCSPGQELKLSICLVGHMLLSLDFHLQLLLSPDSQKSAAISKLSKVLNNCIGMYMQRFR